MSEAVLEPTLTNTEAGKAMLPLDAPRTVVLAIGGHLYRLIFRRITKKDWQKFFEAFRIETLRTRGESVETFEYGTALSSLVRDCIVSVEGYRLDTSKIRNWREMLPPPHVNAAGLALRDVAPQRRVADEPIEITEFFEVRLVASWTATPDGSMTAYTDLIHRFKAPTLEQQKAFNRKVNTTRVIGDSRNGRTIYSEKQKIEMDYYDELIAEVDGYSVNGLPLQDIAQIRTEMDGCHKVAAINAFLRAGDIDMEIPAAVNLVEGDVVGSDDAEAV